MQVKMMEWLIMLWCGIWMRMLLDWNNLVQNLKPSELRHCTELEDA